MPEKIIYEELSYRIMGAVFEVHRTLGPGFMESIYEEALFYELSLHEIPVEKQKIITVTYKNQIIGTHRLDLVVDSKIILELKAVSELTDIFKHQMISYLKASKMKLGILVNFGTPKVDYVRITN